jgi:hypothetical protein
VIPPPPSTRPTDGCLPYAIAAILERPVADIPEINWDLGLNWMTDYRRRLRKATGYTFRVLSSKSKPSGYYIGYFNFGDGTAHASVMKGANVVLSSPGADWPVSEKWVLMRCPWRS